jgi:hypothetical protein
MGNTYVKNGTPVGNEHLCRNCRSGQYLTGYRESEVLVRCCLSTPTLVLPFVVHECTDFEDRHKPTWEQMEKLAIQIEPVRISKKTRGFTLPNPLQPEKPQYEPAVAEDEEEEDENEYVDAVAQTANTRGC